MSFNQTEIEKQRGKFLSKYEDIFQSYLEDALLIFHDVFAVTDSLEMGLAAVRESDAIEQAYNDVFEEVGSEFGVKLFSAFTEDPSLLDTTALLAGIGLAVNTFKQDMVRSINDHTAELLQAFYQNTVDPTSSTPLPVQLIRAKTAWAVSQVYRAERIASSEVNSASNTGRQVAAQMVSDATNGEIVPGKVWVAQNRPETRDDHAEADGQEAELDKPFIVGGEQLMFPQDRSLGATVKNIVNCRCAARYYDENSLTSV